MCKAARLAFLLGASSLTLEASSWSDGTKRAADVAVFHQDLFVLDFWGLGRLGGRPWKCLRVFEVGLKGST